MGVIHSNETKMKIKMERRWCRYKGFRWWT